VATYFLVGLMLATETLFFRLIYKLLTFPIFLLLWPIYGRRAQAPPGEPATVPPAKTEDDAADLIGPLAAVEEDAVAVFPVAPPVTPPPPAGEFKVNAPVAPRAVVNPLLSLFKKAATQGNVDLPGLDILAEAEEFPFELLAKKAQAAAAVLEKTFDQFGLNVKVTEIDTGPVVTQFELDLEPGLRVSKVVNLQDDLGIALRVPAVRVVSPIPGKNTVGVEVPNEKQVTVRLKELITACRDQAQGMRVPIFLGKDVSGRPLIVDLAKMPHLLIAGRTGTGKSVCLNTLISSILMTRSPDDVRMLMIDPKMVELSPYTRIPHLMNPVITDMKKAEAVLAWAVDKMEERYDLLAKVGVRHLDNYNKLGKEKVLERLGIEAGDEEADAIPDRMPYIVIIADEMADLMMTSGKEVESHIIRLAQKSRAVGIHLVLATQKPTVDVITGLIKSNLPARISFQVSSRMDSRVVLDEMGAERLLGNGDMLYLAPGTSNLTRAQGTYISDDEVNAIIEFYSDYEPRYCAEIEQATKAALQSATAGGDGPRERDDMYAEAVEVVIREGRGSCSLLQRALGVGYGRAARMIDHMAEDGIVGDYKGSKSREVVCTLEEWEDRQAELLAER
jgi:S-DNA-T family DNA segregation ATPase FtsK/SpoIIIE